MRKTITKEWLLSQGACVEGIEAWEEHGSRSLLETLKIVHKWPDFAFWLIKRIGLTKKQYVKMAVCSAKLCLKNYKGMGKKDLVNAIKATELCIEHGTKANREALALSAAALSTVAWSAASAAELAAWSAASAVEYAEYALSAAYAAALSTVYVATASATSAAEWSAAEYAARSTAWKKIIASVIREQAKAKGGAE